MTDSKLRIVFMGTPDFAVESLKALVENNYNIVGVITAPDRPAGRGQKLKQSPVKEYALTQNIPVLQPEKLKNEDFLAELKALKADLQVIVAFRMLPEVVWNMPRLGSFNLHGSLLPQYRGAAPINWAVINGEKETGVTTFFLRHEIDTGNVIFNDKIAIEEDDDAGSVHDKLMVIGGKLVVKTVKAIEENKVEAVPQSDLEKENLKDAPKIFKEDCKIDWNNDAISIRNKIRGLSPYPTAWTEILQNDGNKIGLKLFKVSHCETTNLAEGEFETDGKNYFKVGTASTDLLIDSLQMAGKKRMDVKSFLQGFKAENFTKLC